MKIKSKVPSTEPETFQANVGRLSSMPRDAQRGNGARTGTRYCSTGIFVCAADDNN